MKTIAAALLALALFWDSAAHAAFEIDGYGAYAVPSGALLDQFSTFATSNGVSDKKGGFGGGGSILFGKTKEALGGLDVSGLPLISFSSSSASDTVTLIPVLGLLRLRPRMFLIDVGVGLTSLSVSGGAANGTTSSSDITLMGALGVSLGGTIGVDLGARFYYFFDSSGNISALAPFAGVHFLF